MSTWRVWTTEFWNGSWAPWLWKLGVQGWRKILNQNKMKRSPSPSSTTLGRHAVTVIKQLVTKKIPLKNKWSWGILNSLFEELRKWDCISPETAIIRWKSAITPGPHSWLRAPLGCCHFVCNYESKQTRVDCSSRLEDAAVGKTHLGSFLVEPPAYLVYPLDLPIYGQVIQWGAGGALMPWHVHADQVQVLGEELQTHRPQRVRMWCQNMSAHVSGEAPQLTKWPGQPPAGERN